MSWFGSVAAAPPTNLQKQLETIREKMSKTKELTARYDQKYKQLVTFNKLLTEGYINNLYVIVDISNLLGSYSQTLEEVLRQLAAFDSVLASDIDTSSLQHIRDLTTQSLQNVAQFFSTDIDKIKRIFSDVGNRAAVDKLTVAQGSVGSLQAMGRQLIGGRGSRSGRGRGRGRGTTYGRLGLLYRSSPVKVSKKKKSAASKS